MFWVYIGHGHVKTLDYVRANNEYLPIMNVDHVPLVKSNHPPIAIFLACYTGAVDASEDSLAERLVLKNHGPIAAIAASRVSGPYGLAMLSDGLLDSYYQAQLPTLGEIFLASKQAMLVSEPPSDDSPNAVPNDEKVVGASASKSAKDGQLKLIAAMASALSPKGYDLRAERVEHAWQMQLLGDPTLKLKYPQTLDMTAPQRAESGSTISVAGLCPEPGKLLIEFGYLREKVRRELNELPVSLKTQDGRDTYQERYQAANSRMIHASTHDQASGDFEFSISVPAELRSGKYCVRIFVEGKEQCYVAYQEIVIRKPRPVESNSTIKQ